MSYLTALMGGLMTLLERERDFTKGYKLNEIYLNSFTLFWLPTHLSHLEEPLIEILNKSVVFNQKGLNTYVKLNQILNNLYPKNTLEYEYGLSGVKFISKEPKRGQKFLIIDATLVLDISLYFSSKNDFSDEEMDKLKESLSQISNAEFYVQRSGDNDEIMWIQGRFNKYHLDLDSKALLDITNKLFVASGFDIHDSNETAYEKYVPTTNSIEYIMED